MRNSLVRRPYSPLFDDFFRDDIFMPRLSLGNRIDVYQEENKFIVEVDLPGFKKEEINISFNNDLLDIKAEHKEETNEDERDYIYRSRSYSSYERQLRFDNVDHGALDAQFADGVLKIVLPKRSEPVKEAKKIEIK